MTKYKDMTKYEVFKMCAEVLGSYIGDAEFIKAHKDAYDEFAAAIEKAYDDGKLSTAEFNELACTAFYDYPGIKDDDER